MSEIGSIKTGGGVRRFLASIPPGAVFTAQVQGSRGVFLKMLCRDAVIVITHPKLVTGDSWDNDDAPFIDVAFADVVVNIEGETPFSD